MRSRLTKVASFLDGLSVDVLFLRQSLIEHLLDVELNYTILLFFILTVLLCISVCILYWTSLSLDRTKPNWDIKGGPCY